MMLRSSQSFYSDRKSSSRATNKIKSYRNTTTPNDKNSINKTINNQHRTNELPKTLVQFNSLFPVSNGELSSSTIGLNCNSSSGHSNVNNISIANTTVSNN